MCRQFAVILLFINFVFAYDSCSSEDRALCDVNLDVVSKQEFLLPEQFLKEYVRFKTPILFENVYLHPATQFWNISYFFYNPGAAVYFVPLNEDHVVSLRQLMRHRKSIMAFNRTLPMFLRGDVSVPGVLDCDWILESHVFDPEWQLQVHDNNFKIHESLYDQIWCQITGERRVTIFPEFRSDHKLGDLFLTDDILANMTGYETIPRYNLTLTNGSCLYVPDYMLRQYTSPADNQAIIFYWDSDSTPWSLGNKFCTPNGRRSLQEVIFANQEESVMEFQTSWAIRHFIGYLPRNDERSGMGYTRENFLAAVKHDTGVQDCIAGCVKIVNAIFDLLDIDQDTYFTWRDLDVMTVDQFTEKFLSIDTLARDLHEFVHPPKASKRSADGEDNDEDAVKF